MPSSSGPGRYRLKVEGSEVGWLAGSAFSREATLVYKPLGPTVMVHTDRPVYRQGDVGTWGVVYLGTWDGAYVWVVGVSIGDVGEHVGL